VYFWLNFGVVKEIRRLNQSHICPDHITTHVVLHSPQ